MTRSRVRSDSARLRPNLGVYKKPIPFGGVGKPVNQNGCSDHFPMTVTELDWGDGYPVVSRLGPLSQILRP